MQVWSGNRNAVYFLIAVAWHAMALGQDGEVLMTPKGAQVKLVVRQDGALFEEPDANSRSRPTKKFNFFYALKPTSGDEETRNGFYRVSATPTAAGAQGWIPADNVVVWPHREALGLMPRQGRDPALFFASKADLEAYYSGQHVAAISRETPATIRVNLLPILDTFTMNVAGDSVTGYEVGYLHSAGSSGGNPQESNESSEPLIDFSRATVQLAIIMDTTQSTEPFGANMRMVVEKIAEHLARQQGEVPAIELALVCYRDVVSNPPPEWYHVKVFSDFTTDLREYLSRLQSVEAATLSSEDFPEDVLSGIDESLKKLSWAPDSFRHLVVIGDASAHVEMSGPKNPRRLTIEGVIARAQPRGLETIREKTALHCLRVIGLDRSDHQLCASQFRELAAGGDSPGLYYEFDGRTGDPAFVDELASLVLRSREGLRSVKQGRDPAPDTPALGLLLQMTKAAKSAGSVPEFAKGYVCEVDRNAHQQLEPFLLVGQSKADMFTSAVGFLVKLLTSREPGASDLKHFLRQLQIYSADVQLGDAFTGETSLKEFFGKVLAIPVHSKCFEVTLDQLLAMSSADLENWIRDVRGSESIIKAHIDNEAIWFPLADQQNDRFAFIKLADMP